MTQKKLTNWGLLPNTEAEAVLGLSKLVLHDQFVLGLLIGLHHVVDGELCRKMARVRPGLHKGGSESAVLTSLCYNGLVMHLPVQLYEEKIRTCLD